MLGSWFVLSGEISLGELIVGLGTLALAVFTGLLARRTREDVAKTEESLQLTREGIEAQDMPFVIASPDPMVGEVIAIDTFDEGSGMAVRLWNVGKGQRW